MTGFSAEWLALREAADQKARNSTLCDIVAAAFAGQEHVSIVDLACGAGSNLRSLARHLPARQRWRLVDFDPLLLDAAREALTLWAETIESSNPLSLQKEGRRLEIGFQQIDLAIFPGAALEQGVDLVTAAAFFDLASKEWIERFVQDLTQRRLPLYAVLTYSGEEKWAPSHPRDVEMLAAFHHHQRRDKGFGPAAGPLATQFLKETLEAYGYSVLLAPSPWRLGRSDPALIEALADGAAAAVKEASLVPVAAIEDWRQARRSATRCEISHLDLFARPL